MTAVPELLSGVQAVGELLKELQRREREAGRRTGIFVSGYPGSPLGGLDLTLARIPGLTSDHDIHLRPAVNEELAATSVWGSQTISEAMTRKRDGVIGVWYGKHPGLDRASDAIRHGEGEETRAGDNAALATALLAAVGHGSEPKPPPARRPPKGAAGDG